MHLISVFIREKQDSFLKKRKKDTGIKVATQIREAIDDYIKKIEEMKEK